MATEHERSDAATGGLSRRQVLARGAVAAGVVWAAPVIRTATAYATSAAGTERPCTKFYLVCLDVAGPRPIRFDDPDWEYDEIPADRVLERFRPGGDPAPTTTSTSTTTTSTSSTSTTSTSSTTTTSTSSTSTTTTTTTQPFKDPTEGLGLFPDGETTTDPRDKKKRKRRETKKDKDKKPDEETPDPTDVIAGDGATADGAAPVDDLGLFPEEPDPNAIADAATTAPLPDELPPGFEDWLRDNPDVPLRYPEVPPMLTQSGEQAWAVLLPEVEDGPDPANHQCRAVKGWSHSEKSFGEFYVDANPGLPEEEGRRLIFPNPKFDSSAEPPLIDKVFLVYCCP